MTNSPCSLLKINNIDSSHEIYEIRLIALRLGDGVICKIPQSYLAVPDAISLA